MKIENVMYSVATAGALIAVPSCNDSANSYNRVFENLSDSQKYMEDKVDYSILENKKAQEILEVFFSTPEEFRLFFISPKNDREFFLKLLSEKTNNENFIDQLKLLKSQGFIFNQDHAILFLSQNFNNKTFESLSFLHSKFKDTSKNFIRAVIFQESFRESIEEIRNNKDKMSNLDKLAIDYSHFPFFILHSDVLDSSLDVDFYVQISDKFPNILSLDQKKLDNFIWKLLPLVKKDKIKAYELTSFLSENFEYLHLLFEQNNSNLDLFFKLYLENPDSVISILHTADNTRGITDVQSFTNDPSVEIVGKIDKDYLASILDKKDSLVINEQANRIGRSLYLQNLEPTNENVFSIFEEIKAIKEDKKLRETPLIQDRSFLLFAHNESDSRFGPSSICERVVKKDPKYFRLFKPENTLQNIEKVKIDFLNDLKTKPKPTVFFDAHGSPTGIYFSNQYKENVNPNEIAEALIFNQLYNRKNEAAILIFASCNGHTFLRKVLDILNEYNSNNKNKITLPVLFSQSEYGQLAYTDALTVETDTLLDQTFLKSTGGYDDLWDQILVDSPTLGSLIDLSDKNSNNGLENYTLYINQKNKTYQIVEAEKLKDSVEFQELQLAVVNKFVNNFGKFGIPSNPEEIKKQLPKSTDGLKKMLNSTYFIEPGDLPGDKNVS